ncbi:MAG: hypothetical protein EXX96DRAFT_622164 [Benjaminiella poitrasii]|nr:MAG: hypothetical protein EXX96DRAFT_622164 [Benjaminiella poitrasii]
MFGNLMISKYQYKQDDLINLPAKEKKNNTTKSAHKNRMQKKQAAAAHFFQRPSTNHIYIPTKARIPIGKLRTTLRHLGIPNGKLLDIHYPTRNIVYNDYVPELKSTLHQRGVTVTTALTLLTAKLSWIRNTKTILNSSATKSPPSCKNADLKLPCNIYANQLNSQLPGISFINNVSRKRPSNAQ